MYKVIIKDHLYKEWDIVDNTTLEQFILPLNPIESKLFNSDIFSYKEDKVNIVFSQVRHNKYNAGILDLSKTYGKENKFLYLCKPDNIRLPYFLIPYSIPPSFDKTKIQLYITFEYKHWEHDHPYGIISQNIGPVTEIENFYEYIIYCKSLNVSMQPFTKIVLKSLKENVNNNNDINNNIINNICKKYNIIKRNNKVFTIDSVDSIDLDDGMSIHNNTISIYISYVPIIVDYLNLWDSFTNRISSIYLPDKKKSMLPSPLSQLCSLNESEERICFIMDINIIDMTNKISIGCVKINKNYSYDDESLNNNEDYNKIKTFFKSNNSHELVETLMIYFNTECTKLMKVFKNGIYRNNNIDDTNIINNELELKLVEPLKSYINIVKNKTSKYSYYIDSCHYAQFTSPIRRLVDILNIIQLSHNYIIVFEKSHNFYINWYANIDYINETTKNIRKVQNKCKLLNTFIDNNHKSFKGYLFDKINYDKLFKYNVYIPELKLSTIITCDKEYSNYSEHIFKIYVFNTESNIKKKIKLQIQL